MKTLVLTLTVVLLAGCGGMGMRSSSGGGVSSAASDQGYWQRDDAYHSWVN